MRPMIKRLHFAFSTDSVDAKAHEAQPNKRITFDYLRDVITGAAIAPPAEFYELPDLARRAYVDGEKSAADQLQAKKKALPWFLLSGFCPVHHNNETLTYNGALQVDFDFKTADGQQRALDVLQRIKELRPAGVLFAGFSPSIYGVKILLLTDNLDKDRHGEALQAAGKYLQELLQIASKFDGLGASQPCYVPFEREPGQAYFNPDTQPLPIVFPDTTDLQSERPARVYSDDLIAAAARYLIDNSVDVAPNGRENYLQVCGACKYAFGDLEGKQIAWQILESSAAFCVSEFRKKFDKQFRSLKRTGGKVTTGATLVWLAEKKGFSGFTARPGRTFQAMPGEYLTAVLDRYQVDLVDVVGKYIISPTGTGKTTLVAEFLQRYPDRRGVLVVPTLALVNRICKRHRKEGATRFVGRSRNVTPDDRFIVTTPNSFPALATRVDLRLFDVFFDETHGLTSDTSPTFKLKTLRKFYATVKEFAKSITYLTGTPLYNFHPDFDQVEHWTIKAEKQISKTAIFCEADHVTQATVEGMRRSIKSDRRAALLLNDKGVKLAEVIAALDGYNLAILNSDRKDDPVFIEITSTGKIPDGKQAIVTTTVFKEGNDLDDERGFDFFIVGQHHSSTIEQLSARARNAADVRVFIVRGNKREKHDRKINPYRYAHLVIDRAQRLCDEHNNQTPHDDTAALFLERQVRNAIQRATVDLDENGKLQVCYFAVNNEVYQAETQIEYANDTYLAQNLRKYGFKIAGEHVREYLGTNKVEPESISYTYDDATAAATKAARQKCKAEKQKAHQEALDTLQSAVNPLAIVQQAEREKTVPAAFKWLKRLVDEYGIDARRAIDLLREVDTGKKYALLENRIRVQLLSANQTYLDSGRITAILLRKMYATLRPGCQYTAEQLREMLVQVLALDKSINLQFLNPASDDAEAVTKANRRAIALLRMFFEVEKSGRETSGGCPRNWLFSLNKLTQFRGHVKPTKRPPTPLTPDLAEVTRIEKQITDSLVETCPF